MSVAALAALAALMLAVAAVASAIAPADRASAAPEAGATADYSASAATGQDDNSEESARGSEGSAGSGAASGSGATEDEGSAGAAGADFIPPKSPEAQPAGAQGDQPQTSDSASAANAESGSGAAVPTSVGDSGSGMPGEQGASASGAGEAGGSAAGPNADAVQGGADDDTPCAGTMETSFKTADGSRYTVRVSYGADAGLPARAELKVVQLVQTPEGYDPDKREFRDRPSQAEKFLSAKQIEARMDALAQTLDLSDGQTVFYAELLDISVLVDGQAVRPAAPVDVTIETNAVKASQAERVKAAFYALKHPQVLQLRNRSDDAAKYKKYRAGAKLNFTADRLSEVGLLGVADPHEETAAGDAAAAGEADGDAEGSDAAPQPESDADVGLADEDGLDAPDADVEASGNAETDAETDADANAADAPVVIPLPAHDGAAPALALGTSLPKYVRMSAIQVQDAGDLTGEGTGREGAGSSEADETDETDEANEADEADEADPNATFTVTWKNYDGTVLETDEAVPYGQIPEFNGPDPVRSEGQAEEYTFSHWEPAPAPVTADVAYTAQFTTAPIVLCVRDQITGLAIEGASFSLANEAGVTVWSGTTSAAGVVSIPRKDVETAGGGGAMFADGSSYTLKQTASDDAHYTPQGSWTVAVGSGEDAGRFSMERVTVPGDLSTPKPSGPYGIRFYLYNLSSSDITFDYRYPSGVDGQPDNYTEQLPMLSYDGPYTVTLPDPAIDGYEFAGWVVDGSATTVRHGGTVRLDTVNVAHHTMVASWRSPLAVRAFTYTAAGADMVDGSAGTFALSAERSLTFATAQDAAEAYANQNEAVRALGERSDVEFSYATLEHDGGSTQRITSLRYDSASHSWQYRTADYATTWISIDHGDMLNLYYAANDVHVRWVVQTDDGDFTPLDMADKDVVVGSSWASTDDLLDQSDTPVVAEGYYYRWLAFGPAEARDAGQLEATGAHSFWLRNSEEGFRLRTGASGEGDLMAGDTVYVVYAATPPEGSAVLSVENHTPHPYVLRSVPVGAASSADDLLAQGKVVLKGDEALQAVADGYQVPAQSTVQLVVIGGGSQPFVVAGGFAATEGAPLTEAFISAAVVSGGQVTRTTLTQGGDPDLFADTSSVTRGTLQGEEVVAVTFDSDVRDVTIVKEWNDDAYPDSYQVDFQLLEGESAAADDAESQDGADDANGVDDADGAEPAMRTCVAGETDKNGIVTVSKAGGWTAVVANLPARLEYRVAEKAVREVSGGRTVADRTDDFTPTYRPVEDGPITVLNTRSSAVCRVGSQEFTTIAAAVRYIVDSALPTSTIEMLRDYVMAESGSVTVPTGFDITLTTADGLDVATVTRGFAGSADAFCVQGSLTVENVTVSGKLNGTTFAKSGNGGLILVQSGGSLTAGEGAALTGGRAENGSAVYVSAGGSVTLDGARVFGNQASAGGAVGFEDATARLFLKGGSYVYDNRNGNGQDQRNVYLDADSNDVIVVEAPGLAESAKVGVYVPGNNDALYKGHAQPAAPFARFQAGADEGLGSLVNDRLSSGPSKYGCASTVAGLEGTVVWGETFSFTAEVQWLDEHFAHIPVPEGAHVQLSVSGGFATPGSAAAAQAQLSDDTGWTHVFDGLARYDGKGNLCEYTVRQTALAPSDYKRVVFQGDKAVEGNPLSFHEESGDAQRAIVSNYYRYTTFTVEKAVQPQDQGLRSSFAVYGVPKTGADLSDGSMRRGGVGGVNDLPASLRGGTSTVWENVAQLADGAMVQLPQTDRFFTVEGGNRWYLQLKAARIDGAQARRGIDANLGGDLVQFHAFYDEALGEFSTDGAYTLNDGRSWQAGDVIRLESGECSVYAPDGIWHAFASGIEVSYLSFDRQDGYTGVESVGGQPMGKSCTIQGAGSHTFTVADKLSSDYYYYAIETSVQETNGQNRSIAGTSKLVATYNPTYEYDQLNAVVRVTNTRQDCLSVYKEWPADATSLGVCTFDVYEVAEGNTATYLGNASLFKQLVQGTAGTKVGEFTLPEPNGSWVHAVEGPEGQPLDPDKVYFVRERLAGGVAIVHPDVTDSSATTDAVYAYDENINQITVHNMSDVLCKVVDAAGEHPFRTINDALQYGRTRDIAQTGGSNSAFTVQMLRDYSIPLGDVASINAGEAITFTTASTTLGEFRYTGAAGKTKATITRKAGNTSPFFKVDGGAATGNEADTCLMLQNIAFDGAGTETNAISFKFNNATYSSGGIVFARNARIVLQAGLGQGSGVDVRNATAANGGAIYAMGTDVAMAQATFLNCRSTDTNSSVDRGGGALWTSGVGTTTLADSTFADCTAKRNGGALYASSNAAQRTVIRGCSFADCTAGGAGGAVYSKALQLVVGGDDQDEGCSFVRCVGYSRGGGLYHDNTKAAAGSAAGSSTSIRNCRFEECRMTQQTSAGSNDVGGGGFCSNAATMELRNSEFIDCSAYVRGGGGIHYNLDSTSSVVSGCTFTGCTTAASGGGGLEDTALTLSVSNCTFSDCSALVSAGGGIDVGHFDKDKRVTVTDSAFVRCQAGGGDGGGGICSGGETLTVTGCTFQDCTASHATNTVNGGAVSLSPGSTQRELAVYGCIFTGCRVTRGSGGAVYTKGVVLRVGDHPKSGEHTTFADCTASGNGGAIRQDRNADKTQAVIENCSFTSCVSDASGGAVSTSAIDAQLTANAFESCSSIGTGGSVHQQVANANYTRVELDENGDPRIDDAGNPLTSTHNSVDESRAIVSRCTFHASVAGRDADRQRNNAGALYTDAAKLSIAGEADVKTFSDCTAWGAGGAVYHARQDRQASSTDLRECSFDECYAMTGSGGAVFTYAVSLVAEDTSFEIGSANSSGGAVYHDNWSYQAHAAAEFVDCTFASFNSKAGEGGAVYTRAKTLSMKGTSRKSTLSSCGSFNRGGAVYHDNREAGGSKATIENCEFVNCTSSNNSGGAAFIKAIQLEVRDSDWRNCTARSDGGALYHGLVNSSATYLADSFAECTNCTFSACTSEAGWAGALRTDANRFEVKGSPGVKTFYQCEAAGGAGAVYHARSAASSTATIEDCTFEDCTSRGSDGGGGAHIRAAALTVVNAMFKECRAYSSGGGIRHVSDNGNASVAANGSATLKGCVFDDCTAQTGTGGGLYSNTKTLSVTGEENVKTFLDCVSQTEGGGIRHDRDAAAGAQAIVDTCTFERCRSRASAGGGLWTRAKLLDASGLTFTDCSAQTFGGAIWHGDNSNTASESRIDRSRFTTCSAAWNRGGAIYSEALMLTVTGGAGSGADDRATSFFDCSSRKDGGAVCHWRNAVGSATSLSGSKFGLCRAVDASGSESRGGAVYSSARALTVADSLFDTCTARNEGGIVMHNAAAAATLSVTDSTLANGTSNTGNGGGIYSARSNVTLTNTSVTGCSAAYDGGALYQSYSDSQPVLLQGCTVSGNTAGRRGGGVYFDSNNTLTLRGWVPGANSDDASGAVVHTSVTGNKLNVATVENAAGIYLSNDRNGAILVLGAEGVEEDTITVYDNTTSNGEQSNVRLIRSNTYNSKAKRYENKHDESRGYSVSLLSSLVKPGVGSQGSIGVCNPGPENTRFGLMDVEGHTGMEYIMSDIDVLRGKLDPADYTEHKRIVWFAPKVCKITDQNGRPLTYEGDKTAAFSSLSEAFEVLNVMTENYLKDDRGVTPKLIQLQMLVPTYRLEANMPALKRDIVFTTAEPGTTDTDYPMNAPSSIATITRGPQAAGSMFTVGPGVKLTVGVPVEGSRVNGNGIVLDGGRYTADAPAVTANGGIIYGQADAQVVLGEYATLRNSLVGGGASGGAVYMTGGSDPDAVSLVMDGNAAIVGCSAYNGGGVFLTGGASFALDQSPHIEGCTAESAGGAVYVSPYAAMTFRNNPNPVIAGNGIADPSGRGAGIFLASNESKLNVALGASASIRDNYVAGTAEAGRTNGGDDYSGDVRQDIYLAETKDPVTSLVVTGRLSQYVDPIWVWAESPDHYKTEMQFAVLGNGVEVPDDELAVFRNARGDQDSENDTDSYLYGIRGDDSAVIWSYVIGTSPVILSKVSSSGGEFQTLGGAVFAVYKGNNGRPYVVRHEDGTSQTLAGLVSRDDGVFWTGTLPFGTYYLEETTVPGGHDTSRRWFRLTIDETGTSMTGGYPTRQAIPAG